MKKRRGDPSSTNAISFRDRCKFEHGVNKLQTSLSELRAEIEKGNGSSVGRAVGRLYAELIVDLLRFMSRFDYSIGRNLFTRDFRYALKDNFRQEIQILGMYSRLLNMLTKASDGLIACFGGYETIGIEVLANWAAAGNPTGSPDPRRLQVLESVTSSVRARNVERKQRKKT